MWDGKRCPRRVSHAPWALALPSAFQRLLQVRSLLPPVDLGPICLGAQQRLGTGPGFEPPPRSPRAGMTVTAKLVLYRMVTLSVFPMKCGPSSILTPAANFERILSRILPLACRASGTAPVFHRVWLLSRPSPHRARFGKPHLGAEGHEHDPRVADNFQVSRDDFPTLKAQVVHGSGERESGAEGLA